MTWYDEEYVRLSREVWPWRYWDPVDEKFKFKDGTPQDIIDKDKRCQEIYDALPKSWTSFC